MTPAQLPPAVIIVPGPGPNESHSGLSTTDNPDHPEAVASREPRPNQGEDEDAGSDQDEDNAQPNSNQDPYSNLDGAFGNYLADEPQPITASNRAGRHNEVDDLLF